MADTLAILFPGPVEFPATNPATPAVLANGRDALAFDDTTSESIIFAFPMPAQYAAGTITLKVYYAMDTATTGDVDLDASIEAVTDAELVDLDSFDTVNSVDGTTVPGTANDRDSVSITLTNKDSVAVGESVRLKLARDVADTASGDLWVVGVELQE